MKIQSLNATIDHLVQGLRSGDRAAQKVVYERYCSRLLGICRKYINDEYQAEDVLMKSFLKIFSAIDTYEGRGNFEGWMHRICVFESISHIRANKKFAFTESIVEDKMTQEENNDYNVDQESLQWMVDQLPEGCKAVFLLYAIDGYKHHEIGQLLSISEGTSKSQLSYARKLLQQLFKQESESKYGTSSYR
jgi:RNA polymerase sigma factor (sigma-70 family)